MSRIGLIQTRGVGDIIIALPIADFLIENGHEVFWPIDARFVRCFNEAAPHVHFLPVADGEGYFLEKPLELLAGLDCQRIIPLYSDLSGSTIVNEALTRHLRFDEYKYAMAEVPFARKWKLRIQRNAAREMALHQRLGIAREYVCVHTRGSDFSVTFTPSAEWQERYQIIEIRPLTDSPFDWLYTLEHASKLVLLESCFSNLVDQLNMEVEKYLILKFGVHYTPTLINGWRYITGPVQQNTSASSAPPV